MTGAFWATVTSVNDDGTVNIDDGRGGVPSRPALSGYMDRAVGDRVLVTDTRAGLVVLGEPGGAWSPPVPETALQVSTSDPPSGAGWITVTTNVWGNPETGGVWVKTTAAPPPPAGGRVVVGATRLARFRDGGRVGEGYAEQGGGFGYGNHTGLVMFDAGFGDAAGKTITGASITWHRSNSSHGSFAATAPTWWLHNEATLPNATPGLTGHGAKLGAAERNQTVEDYPFDLGYAQALADGTALGLGVQGSLSENVEIDRVTLVFTY